MNFWDFAQIAFLKGQNYGIFYIFFSKRCKSDTPGTVLYYFYQIIKNGTPAMKSVLESFKNR